jgi:hypothetical protein
MAAANTTRHTQRKADWKKLGWKVSLAAASIAFGYAAWLLIPFVVRSDLLHRLKRRSSPRWGLPLYSPNSLRLPSLAKRQSTF